MARKRTSMREGPLAELFRATEAAQQEGKQAPAPAEPQEETVEHVPTWEESVENVKAAAPAPAPLQKPPPEPVPPPEPAPEPELPPAASVRSRRRWRLSATTTTSSSSTHRRRWGC